MNILFNRGLWEAAGLTIADLWIAATLVFLIVVVILGRVREPITRLAIVRAMFAGIALLSILIVASSVQLVTLPKLSLTRHQAGQPDLRSTPADTIETYLSGDSTLRSSEVETSEQSSQTHTLLLPSRTAIAAPSMFHSLVEVLSDWRIAIAVAQGFLALMTLLWLFAGMIFTAWIYRKSEPAPEELQTILRNIATANGRLPALRIVPSRWLGQPVAVGLFRIAILLPSGFVQSVPAAQIEAAIAHEWAHLSHGDLWLIAVSRWLLTIFALHPLYGWIRRTMRNDLEFLADAAVTDRQHVDRTDYANILLIWVKTLTPKPIGLSAGSGLWERPSQVERRIMMLLERERQLMNRSSLAVRIALAVTVTAVAPLFALPTLSPTSLSVEQPPTRHASTFNEGPDGENVAKSGGRIFGRIVNAETQKPIEGATVRITHSEVNSLHGVTLKVTTDREGKYSVAIGPGMYRVSTFAQGHWGKMEEAFANSLLTPMQKESEVNFSLHQGTRWRVRAVTDVKNIQSSGLYANAIPANLSAGGASTDWIFGELDANGQATIGMPTRKEKWQLRMGRTDTTVRSQPQAILLDVADHFDPEKAEKLVALPVPASELAKDPAAKAYEVIDSNGVSARIFGAAEPSIQNKQLLIAFTVPAVDKNALLEITGTVNDPDGKPAANAEVAIVAEFVSGGEGTAGFTTTNATGRYQLHVLPKSKIEEVKRLRIIARSSGSADGESTRFQVKLPEDGSAFIAPTTSLAKATSLRGQVIDANGKPAAGISVSTFGPINTRRNALTNETGFFEMKDLAANRVVTLTASDKTSTTTFSIIPSEAKQPVILKLSSPERPGANFRNSPIFQPTKMKVGASAAPWNISAWLDGNQHALTDSKGKYLVLLFWERTDKSWLEQRNFYLTLPETWKARNVQFVAIHGAGSTEAEVRTAAQKFSPSWICGLDSGTNFWTDSKTGDDYEIQTWHHLVVIDPAGKIVFRTDDRANMDKNVPALMKRLGYKIGYALDQQEVQKILSTWITEELEKVFAGK